MTTQTAEAAATCTCNLHWTDRTVGSHLPKCPALGSGLRGVTEAEHRLLNHVTMWGSDGYPVHKAGRNWTWGTLEVSGPPTVFKTKRDAVESFRAFEDVLIDALAGRG